MAGGKHAFGEGVRSHPRLYAFVTSGGWDRSHTWQALPTWDQDALRELFEIDVFRLRRRRDLPSQERMDLMRSWPHQALIDHIAISPANPFSITVSDKAAA